MEHTSKNKTTEGLSPDALVVKPVAIVTACPKGHPHIDEGEWATRPHKTHKCQYVYPLPPGHIGFGGLCGDEWRPAHYPTVGVEKL